MTSFSIFPFSQFWGQFFFQENLALPRSTSCVFLAPSQNKKLIKFHKNMKTHARRDGRTDFPATAGSKKKKKRKEKKEIHDFL